MNGVQLILVVVAALAISGLARRKGLQPALVITVLAIGASFIPGIPRFELESEVILSIVLPPLLYTAALEFSFDSFRKVLNPVLSLGIFLVLVTALIVALIANAMVPALTFASALVLGAAVAPPDAVAAIAIGRENNLPRRMMDILKGESLINDGAALTIFSLALASLTGSHQLVSNPVLLFLYSSTVGVAVGMALAYLMVFLRRRMKEPALETVLGLLIPFASFLLAEQLEASGVLAVVAAGFIMGSSAESLSYATRTQERQVWRAVEVLLEAFVFAYVGLQCKFILDDLLKHDESLRQVALTSLVILLTVILVRVAWITLAFSQQGLMMWFTNRVLRRIPSLAETGRRHNDLRESRGLPRRTVERTFSPAFGLVTSWTGMRGVVTLAAAASIPSTLANGEEFPAHAVIQAVAFTVAVGTLLVQGTTLPILLRAVKLKDNSETHHRQQQIVAQGVVSGAAKTVVQNFQQNPPAGLPPEITAKACMMIEQRSIAFSNPDGNHLKQKYLFLFDRLSVKVMSEQRQALLAARKLGQLDGEIARDMLERLDYQEAASVHRLTHRGITTLEMAPDLNARKVEAETDELIESCQQSAELLNTGQSNSRQAPRSGRDPR